jgi:collagenase-like PrtC family protease
MSTKDAGAEESSAHDDSTDDGARAVAPREYTRGFYTDERFDDRFRDDPPVRNVEADDA